MKMEQNPKTVVSMPMITPQYLLILLVFIFTNIVFAELLPITPDEYEQQLEIAQEFNKQGDVAALLEMLNTSHIYVSRRVALMLGRLGAEDALPSLKEKDKRLSNFACAPSGQFGVAVMLIENKNPEAQKKALLTAVTTPINSELYSYSVIDEAGRELSRYEGDDIIEALKDVNTYGAQYTVLKIQCRGLSPVETIATCIEILQAHETPQKAQAAQDILVEIGPAALPAVESLKAQAAKTMETSDPKSNISKTIYTRCEFIQKGTVTF